MKKIFTWSILGISCWILLNGCAQKQLYYFGDYSNTLYSSEKSHNEESLLKHKQELERIIAESEKRNMMVPPGIYAELGFMNLKNNNLKESINFFQMEAKLYPESKHFMDRLIQMASKRESDDSVISTSSEIKGENSN